jgi:hypothetical protein
MAKSVQATVQKWTQNAGAAQGAYTDGIQATSVDVMGKAIAAAPAAVRNYNDALSSGRWAAAINASGGTANWKAMSAAKAGNYGTGITAGTSKFQKSMGVLLPAIEGIVSSLPARQPGNVQANIQRVSQLALALHARKGEFKG